MNTPSNHPHISAGDSDITGASVGGEQYPARTNQVAGSIANILLKRFGDTEGNVVYTPQTPVIPIAVSPSAAKDFYTGK